MKMLDFQAMLAEARKKATVTWEYPMGDGEVCERTICQSIPGIICDDGFKVSVQAGEYLYSEPREDGYAFYSAFELGFPSERVEAWQKYAEEADRPTETLYGYVPAEVVLEELNRRGNPRLLED